MSYKVEHLIAQDDLAAAYLRSTATHDGDFLGLPATGRAVPIRGIYHCQVVDGLIVEDWDVFDLLTPVFLLGGAVAPA